MWGVQHIPIVLRHGGLQGVNGSAWCQHWCGLPPPDGVYSVGTRPPRLFGGRGVLMVFDWPPTSLRLMRCGAQAVAPPYHDFPLGAGSRKRQPPSTGPFFFVPFPPQICPSFCSRSTPPRLDLPQNAPSTVHIT